eukprot:TRINITY_DN1212_c0_g1_i1.p1 TRINITY_DN1212_c0_g1~~TRINITY_DN1212_c0_g1_i1.p1  ORF type:complete len:953 (-),score=271.28 TRINITY_DN1212_c0_g1_i1:66-2846(-)
MKAISKYRTAQCRDLGRGVCYPDVRPAVSSSGECGAAVASDGYIVAVAWAVAAGGAAAFLPYAKYGKHPEPPLLHTHSGGMTDMAFSPVHPNTFVTSGEDALIKFWKPNPIDPSNSPAIATLSGHKKSVFTFALNPTAADVVISSSNDKTFKVWDVAKSSAVFSADVPDVITGLSWNYNGSLVASTCKDKKLRLIDPRGAIVSQEGICHEGTKPSKVTWMGKHSLILTTGYDKTQGRQFAIWDPRNFSKHLKMVTLGSSAGICNPLYDADTDLFFLSSKGEGIVRVYEGVNGDPYVSEVTSYTSDTPSKGIAMVPKTALNVMACEVAQLLKVTSSSITPISVAIPRKLRGFQPDLYPDTAACIPALKSAEWFSGASKEPITVSLVPKESAMETQESSPSPVVSPSPMTPSASASASASSASPSVPSPSNSPANPKPVSATAASRSSLGPSPVASPSAPIVRYTKFRHLNGEAFMKNKNIEELRVNPNTSLSLLQINPMFFASPWQGVGGRLAVWPWSKVGRVPSEFPWIQHGSEIVDFAWNPFDHHCIATGGEDCHVKIWKIPSDNGLASTILEPIYDLAEHKRKIATVNWHPTAENVLVSSSIDSLVKFWDVTAEKSIIELQGHTDTLYNLSFDWTGSCLATACRDKYLRIWDPRGDDPLVGKTIAHEGAKGFKVAWCGRKNMVVTGGFSKTSERQISLWDVRDLSKPVNTRMLDQQSGTLTLTYDADVDVFAVYGKGDGNVRFFEVTDEEPYVHLLTESQSGVSIADMDFMPKTFCNVKTCELMQSARLVGAPPSTVERISFIVPRTRTEYFQDDIFPPTRTDKPTFTAPEWFASEKKEVASINRQPTGMKKLSEAPVIERQAKYHMPTDEERHTGHDLTRNEMFDKFYNRMQTVKSEVNAVNDEEIRKKDEEDGWAVKEEEWD